MRAKFYIVIFGLCFLATPILNFTVNAQGKNWKIGIQSGLFIPQEWSIRGMQQIAYTNGNPVSIMVNGFGQGGDINLIGAYYFSDWGIMAKAGVRLLKNDLDMSLAPNGDHDVYENHLTIFPVTLDLVRKISSPGVKVTPYFAFGLGIYYSEWEQKHFPEGGTRVWTKGNASPLGINVCGGLDYAFYHDLMLNFEVGYCYIPSDLKIKNVDTNDQIEMRNLNLGGVTFNLGLAFRF
jgi:outer membrane protein W